MTRDEMISLGCGKYVPNRTAEWYRKRDELYKLGGGDGLWKFFRIRREDFRKRFGGNGELSNMAAQAEIDELLFQQAEGHPIVLPDEQEGEGAVEAGDNETFLHNRSEFGEAADAEMDPVRDLTWIYNNIGVKNVKPSEAPSPGAYAHLKFIQQNDANMVDFFTKVYPRIIPSKSQIESLNKFNDDGRDHLAILDRLAAEMGKGAGQIPDIQLDFEVPTGG